MIAGSVGGDTERLDLGCTACSTLAREATEHTNLQPSEGKDEQESPKYGEEDKNGGERGAQQQGISFSELESHEEHDDTNEEPAQTTKEREGGSGHNHQATQT